MIYLDTYKVSIDRADAPEESEGRILVTKLTKTEAIAFVEAEEKLWGEEFQVWMEREL